MRPKVLIIPADDAFVPSLAAHLKSQGFSVITAATEAKVRRIISRKRIDVVLLGVGRLRRRALAVLGWIKQERPFIEVILINTSDQISLSIEGMKLGAFDDFILPLELSSLTESVIRASEAKKRAEGKGKGFLSRYERIMAAAAYAEMGEDQMAVEIAREAVATETPNTSGMTLQQHGSWGISKEFGSKNHIKQEAKMKEIKILLVDDEEDFVKTLAERIQMRDLNSDIALNGEQALKIVEDEVPDVMVLDLRMPGIDGMEVLRRVTKAYPDVKVIILTGHGSKKDEEEARRLGAFEYLEKPADINKLVDVIRKAYLAKVEGTMVAGAFAEAGEFETAREILKDRSRKEEDDKAN